MASTGIMNSTNDPLNFGVGHFSISPDGFVGPLKLGGVQTDPDSVAGGAVRHKTLSVTIAVATTTQTVAHGLTDQDGNPIAPVRVSQISAPAAGDTIESVTAPDATNIYVAASAIGTYVVDLEY